MRNKINRRPEFFSEKLKTWCDKKGSLDIKIHLYTYLYFK